MPTCIDENGQEPEELTPAQEVEMLKHFKRMNENLRKEGRTPLFTAKQRLRMYKESLLFKKRDPTD